MPSYTWPPTLAEMRSQLGDTSASIDAAKLQGVLDAAVSVLENHPDYRVKDAVTATTYTEWRDASGGKIVLGHYPVVSIMSITEYTPTAQALAAEPLDTTATFTGYGYTVDALAGILYRTSGGSSASFRGRVKIVYQAGATVVPPELRTAALKLAQHMWGDQRGGSPANAVLGGQDFDQPPGTAHLLPWEVEEALAPYRRAPSVA